MYRRIKSNNKGPALSLSKGFTLIEIMVAVSIFIIVAFVASSAFITVNNANKKAQAIRLIVDNLNFTLDGMTYRLAEGVDYKQSSTEEITFTSRLSDDDNKEVTYAIIDRATRNDGEGYSIYLTNSEFPDGVSLISPEISIEGAKFEVINNNGRAYVAISLRGKAKIGREETTLNLQTAVTQRNY